MDSKKVNQRCLSSLEWAEFYLSQGFSIIPLTPKDKTPAIQWKDYQTRKPTRDELNEWFTSGKNNIGIVTGKISGIAVVDLDSDAAKDFAQKNGFPDTPSVRTGKGCHLYYKYPDDVEVRNFQKRDDLPDIDLRGDGGYVVAPPSIHSSGSVYKWIDSKGLDDLPLSPAFPDMILIKKNEKTPITELLSGVPGGKRNDSLFRAVCGLKKVGANYDDCLNFAYWLNERNNPPLSGDEVERTLKGIFDRYHDQKPVFQFSDPIYMQETKKLDLNNFDYSDVLKKGIDLQKLDIKVEWIIDNILPKQSITLLHGRGGIGKTWLSLQIGEAVSNGKFLFGHSTQRIPVYYIDLENSFPMLVERVKKLAIEQIYFWHNSNVTPPPKIDSADWVVYRDKFPSGLLIIDTLRAFQSLDENSSQHMAAVMSNLKMIRDKGFTILLLHHTPKSNERTYKGSTAIFDLCDHVLSIHGLKQPNTEEEDEFGKYRWFGTKDKTRYTPFSISLMFDPDKGFLEVKGPDAEDSGEIRLLIAKFLAENDRLPTQSEVIDTVTKELGLSKSRVQKLLDQGEYDFWITKKGGVKNKKLYQPVFDFRQLKYEAKTKKLIFDDVIIELVRKCWLWEAKDQIDSTRKRRPGFEMFVVRLIDGLLKRLRDYNAENEEEYSCYEM
jgi:archaellum biogenesis ATPase FlaH